MNAELVFVLALFMISGGCGFTLALMGYAIEPKYLGNFQATPYAFFLVAIGTVGVLTMANSWKHKRAWLRLVVGFGMVLLAYIYLDALLHETWGK